MSANDYIICRKQTKPKCNQIPKSTYVAETFVSTYKPEPIKTNPYFENLSRPKQKISPPPPQEIPKYENHPPEFDEVDYRVTKAALSRDLEIMHRLEREQEEQKASEPTQFLEWQRTMREKDEEEKRMEIQKRREELDDSRKKAIKAKKAKIEDKLEIGRRVRKEFGAELDRVNAEIEAEREQIVESKRQMDLNEPSAVKKMQKQKLLEAREVRSTLRKEMKLAAKIRTEENKTIHDNAVKLREQLLNHTNRHGDAFREKIEITDTKFLAALTDEEATKLIETYADDKRRDIEQKIEEHRAVKEEKMQKLVTMLNEVTRAREEKEAEHEKRRKEKREEEERENKRKEEEEEQKVLMLEKKLEKKRKQRITEAEEMEEHARQIDARTRYLALNKKALATKVFQSQQDGKLRAAKERQSLAMKERMPEKKTLRNSSSKAELKSLKALLGM